MPRLTNYGLRLPVPSVQRLHRLNADLQASGLDVTAGSIMRGLCLLALELARDAAGARASFVVRIVVCDPTSIGAYRALKAFRSLLTAEDADPPTVPTRDAHDYELERPQEDLRGQALRLPPPAPEQIEELVRAMCALGFDASRCSVARGLCMLALHLASGEAGADVARAVSVAINNPTVEGAQQAVELLRLLLEHEHLPTQRERPSFTEVTSDSTPPTLHSACAA